ncbi:MAG: hypothetical protein PW843_00095 [Azospirillaceae bacterium]|nr:hypothetical protein [Azospirillaceae bacterium]
MKQISGRLTMLGDSIVKTNQCDYSLIKIGNNILQSVVVPSGINNFLDVHNDGETTIYYVDPFLFRKVIVGIGLPSGEKYCMGPGFFTSVMLLLCSIILIPLLGFGLLFLPTAVGSLVVDSAAAKLRDQGFEPIK